MNQKIFIFGTSHEYQRPDSELPKHQIMMFDIELRKLCSKYAIRALSEENSLEAQGEKGLQHSLPYSIAKSLKIAHQYCDPDWAKRNKLGIRQKGQILAFHSPHNINEDDLNNELAMSHQLRERYWLKKIVQQNLWPTLLVCGASHVTSVASQAFGLGLKVQILEEDWPALEE